MPEIRVLPTHLVNKIAAGEVIERPASVVKELVENALDAGATAIEITVEDGGKRLIAVRDNGKGMGPGDLALAFSPHATSKIASEDDLFRIQTLGFRGEALASIASVSQAQIVTRKAGNREPGTGSREEEEAISAGPQSSLPGPLSPVPCPRSADTAWEIRAEGETIQPSRPVAAPEGTTVTVRNLFYNTPGRRKFMRTGETEFGHIVEQLARLALPCPQVAFRLTHTSRLTHELAAGDLRRRVADLFGPDLADSLIEFDGREALVRVSGLLGPPIEARASGRWQYFFVNGRFVRDRTLLHALREAYRGLVDPSRWPVAFVFLEVPPDEIDVNVHPTKMEIRFRQGQPVHSQVVGAIRDALNQANFARPVALGRASGPTRDDGPSSLSADEREKEDDPRRQSLKQALADFFKSAPPPQPTFGYPPRDEGGYGAAPPTEPDSATATHFPPRSGGGADPFADLRAGGAGAADDAGAPRAGRDLSSLDIRSKDEQPVTVFPPLDPLAPPPADAVSATPGAQFPPVDEEDDEDVPMARPAVPRVVQIHNAYIVTGVEGGLAIIDQHALHERILYEELERRLSAGKLTSQQMLIPEVVEISQADKATLAERADLLDRLGLEVTEFGPSTVAVQRYPMLLAERKVPAAEFLRDLLDLLGEQAGGDAGKLLGAVLAEMACKAAVKAGDPLTEDEIHALLERRNTIARSFACPHGRPTTLVLTLDELAKYFKRS